VKIVLRVVGHLKVYTGKEELRIEMPESSSILELLANYKIKSGEVMCASINGKRVDKESLLHDGDELLLVPLAGGG
jgi:molybdopterin converting factor small subunit